MVHQLLSSNRCLFRMEKRQETTTSQSSNRILPIRAEQTSIAILTSTHSKVGKTILSSPGQSSADLMIAGVQELHCSTFDATAMQTDPSEGRNQLRSDKVSAYRKLTLDQGYLSENPTNRYQTAQESLQQEEGPFCNWWTWWGHRYQ
jgi:hypothetical protein